MKKVLLFVLTIGLFTFTSCSEDNGVEALEVINGRWDLEDIQIMGSTDFNGISMTMEGSISSLSGDNFIVFNNDNTYNSVSGNVVMDFTITMPGMSPITQSQAVEGDFFENGTWDKQGNKISITPDSTQETYVLDIEEFSSSKLVLSSDEATLMDIEGMESFSEMNVKMILVR